MLILDFPPELPLALDNDIFTHLRNKHDYVLEKAKQHLFDTKQFPVIPSTTIFEARFGIENGLVRNIFTDEQANYQKQEIDNLLSIYSVIDFNQKAAEIAAYVRPRIPKNALKKEKGKEKKFWQDIFIVATAISHNYGLATKNKRDMELIANHLPEDLDLRLAIWQP